MTARESTYNQVMNIEGEALKKMAGATKGGGLSAVTGWLAARGKDKSGGGSKKTAADWENQETAKKLDYGRQIEAEKRQSKQKRSEARSAERLRQKAAEFNFSQEERRRNQSLSDMNLDQSFKGIKRTPTSFEVSRDTTSNRAKVTGAGGSRQTPSGTSGVVEGPQFNKRTSGKASKA